MERNTLHLFEMGGGREEFVQDLIQCMDENLNQNLIVLLPNRVMKESIQEDILEIAGGYMGLTFLSFDEFVQDMTLLGKDRDYFILPYLLRERILGEMNSFPHLASVSSFLSTSEILTHFYLQALEKEEENFSELPLPFIDELQRGYELFQDILLEREMMIPEIIYARGLKDLEEIDFASRKFFLYGFSSFRNREWAYITKIIERGGQFFVYYPFGKEEEHPLTVETVNHFDSLSFERVDHRREVNRPSFRFFWTLRNGELYHRILEEVAKIYEEGCSLEHIAILTTTEEEREGILALAESYKIPIARKREEISIPFRQLLLEIKRSFLTVETSKENLLLHVNGSYIKIFQNREEFLKILQKLDFSTIGEMKKNFYENQSSSLSSEEYEIFREEFLRLEQEIENLQRRHSGSLRGKISYIKDLTNQIQWDQIGGLVEEEKVLFFDILDRMERFSQGIGEISLEEFFSLFNRYIKEQKEIKRSSRGLQILTLSESIGLSYKHLFLLNLNEKFPPKEVFHYLRSMPNREELSSASYFLDDNQREEEMTLLFLYQVARAQNVYFARYGGEYDRSYLYTHFLQKMSGEEETILNECERQKYSFQKELTYESNLYPLDLEPLDESARNQVERDLSGNTYSSTQLDRFISCPYRYFVDELLLKDQNVEDKSLEKAKEIGIIYHTILENFFKNQIKKEEIYLKVKEEFSTRYRQELFADYETPFLIEEMGENLLSYIEREEGLHGRENEYSGFIPYLFEEKFRMSIGPYQFAGTIDRIDRNERGEELIIDYKKNWAPSLADYREGRSFQLSLYGYWRNSIGSNVVGMGYGSLEQKRFINIMRNEEILGKFPRFTSPHANTYEIQQYFENLPNQITSVIDEIKQGIFPPIPREERYCAYCPYLDFCRKEEVE